MLQKSKAHLDEVKESYFEHMHFALKYSMGCLKAALYAAIHAFIPGCCKNSASDQIRHLHAKLEGRIEND